MALHYRFTHAYFTRKIYWILSMIAILLSVRLFIKHKTRISVWHIVATHSDPDKDIKVVIKDEYRQWCQTDRQ